MAEISTRFGTGGSNLTPGGASAVPSIATALRDIAEDLADIVAIGQPSLTAPAAGAAIAAFTDPPSAGEMATLRTRVNEIITLINEIRTDMVAMAAAAPTLRTTAV